MSYTTKKITIETQEVEQMWCNKCGKEFKDTKEEKLSISKYWGYSKFDLQFHEWDICINCYEKFIDSFTIPISIEFDG